MEVEIIKKGTDENICQEQELNLCPLPHESSTLTNYATKAEQLDGLIFLTVLMALMF